MFKIKRNTTDALFSDLVRDKADWKCERCHRHYVRKESLGGSGLECSHYWGRKNKSVRWDFENAASLCNYCHRYFTENPAEHTLFFLKRLGQYRYDQLTVRAHTTTKTDEGLIRMGLKLEMKAMKEKRKLTKIKGFDFHV